MVKTQKKVKRVQPIIRAQKAEVERESAILGQIRGHKDELKCALGDAQRKYMNGIDELNQIRESQNRDNLSTLESALDYIKAEWHKLYKRVQTVEKKEVMQLKHLQTAQKKLRSAQKLQERYQDQLKMEISKLEQQSLDEVVLHRHTKKKTRTKNTY